MSLKKLAMGFIGLVILLNLSYQPTVLTADDHAFGGRLLNGTSGDAVNAGHHVSLKILDPKVVDNEMFSVTNVSGEFFFAGLPQDSKKYRLTVIFDEVPYQFEIFEPSSHQLAEFTVYEKTDDIRIIEILDETLTIMGVDHNLSVIEILHVAQIENSQRLTFVNDPAGSNPMNLLRFALPGGANNLDVRTSLSGGNLIQVDRGFALTSPVPPGKHDLLVTYHVPYTGKSWRHSIRFPLGTKMFRLLLPGGLAKVLTDHLSERGIMEIGNTTYSVYESIDNKVGARVEFELTEIPLPPLSRRITQFFDKTYVQLGVGPAILGICTLTVLVYFVASRSRPTWGRLLLRKTANSNKEYRYLFEAIVLLDREFNRGEVDKVVYDAERGKLKSLIAQRKLDGKTPEPNIEWQ